METLFRPASERGLPLNWPEDVSLPTIEECGETVQAAEEMIIRELEGLKGKLRRGDSKMLNTDITI